MPKFNTQFKEIYFVTEIKIMDFKGALQANNLQYHPLIKWP